MSEKAISSMHFQKRKEILPTILSEDILSKLLDEVLTQYTTTRIASLYKCHLPDEERKILMYTIPYEKFLQMIEIFKDVIVKDRSWIANINGNIFYDCKDPQFWKKLTERLNKELEVSIFDVELTYSLFVFFIRTISHLLLTMVFYTLGINLDDSNVSVEYGSMGTPGRIAKMWTCKNIHDLTEPLSGRFALEPELVVFPATDGEIGKPVTVTVTINAVCSHHLFRFGNEFRNPKSRAVISYIPETKVLGLSKINRWVEWVARRGWLQEELTMYMLWRLKEKLETENVYVGLINMQHGCVAFRGKNDALAYTSTEQYSGKYEDADFRNEIINSIQ